MQQFLHISGLKHEQKLCLETVAQKRDVFGILQTAWFREESYISIAAASTEKFVETIEHACVLVVTPLVSITH